MNSTSVIYATDALKTATEKLKDVSSNIFPASRPKTVKEQMKSFIVLSCPTRWSDRGIFQVTTMRIQCFYREKENGIMPVGNIDKMIQGVYEQFPSCVSRFTFGRPTLIHNCASDGLGFGYCTIHIPLQVNTTDNFNK